MEFSYMQIIAFLRWGIEIIAKFLFVYIKALKLYFFGNFCFLVVQAVERNNLELIITELYIV
jgi:hypothetical protein